MTFNTAQEIRFDDFMKEIKDCQNECGKWTKQQYCDWVNEWVDTGNNYAGYVKQGGIRPHRPHNP